MSGIHEAAALVPQSGLDGEFWSTQGSNLLLAAISIVAFIAVVALVMFGADLVRGRIRDKVQLVVLITPVLVLLGIGLVYPVIDTVWLSFTEIVKEPDPVTGINTETSNFVGLQNYIYAFTDPTVFRTILNTLVWIVLVPLLSTGVGLAYAVFIDRAKGEKALKSLVFMPMAISFVGASVIWGSIMYDYNETGAQTGMLNAVLGTFGIGPINFLAEEPWNTFFLIVILSWIQTGFAMVIISAAIKGVPPEINEAASLDGANSWQRFWRITVPSIRGTLVVVMTTITIATLKVYDIVRTLTQGRYNTDVVANKMYVLSFVEQRQPLGAALAVILFIFVIPIVIYNVRSLQKVKETR
ncbi:carbohydrate ABC transporter permease [Demequina zhanjiangensis]|uniref:Sugar ABC transporter permease n=1 Tax=Demequina zhanjiangensis TaxID=3051659 RepID=A0ABT8FZQ6_9MICO|nr:sugar ABC transporter permease [Demequina sp. SYSU T00b26]MDN4472194.1 sugar ABC transporter permease [Demequina sp. SYSU T00b26]